MQSLEKFIRFPLYKEALTSYAQVALKRHWGVPHKLEMYNWAKLAFELSVSEKEKRQAFYLIYGNLKSGWKIFRNARHGYWSADEVFDGLNYACKSFNRQTPLTLSSLGNNTYESRTILAALEALGDIKPASDFPWMPVAKFTHFYNPRLFPIYDYEVIWKKVLNGAFRDDYSQWCNRYALKVSAPGAQFNLNYMLYAGHVLRQAHTDFMSFFGEWFREQVSGEADQYNVLNDVSQYYATAFEFVAIGAATLIDNSHP